MTGFIITWIVTTVTFVILTKLPTGIESESLGKSAIAALIFGLLNGLTGWFINNPIINVFTLGFMFLIGNTILFGLTALLVKGFRLRWGIMSAVIGALGVTVINQILFQILRTLQIT
ncbi:MAG: phage holin family protein [Phormidesmis sp. RL_2_1]|nr:phage holin family protein [Phormidesmis sp. RL_2_1]